MDKLDEYKKITTEVVQKQMVILGPDIALLKARNVSGLSVGGDGVVTSLAGDPKVILQGLIDEYVSLSGLIVRKALEPLLQKYPDLIGASGI